MLFKARQALGTSNSKQNELNFCLSNKAKLRFCNFAEIINSMKTKIPKKSVHILPILANFQAELLQIYGENLEGIILFGSYARGDFRQGSDIDLLLLFEKNFNPTPKDNEVYDKIAEIILAKQYVISLIPASCQLFETKNSPLYLNIRKEGIEIWRK